VKDVAEDLQSTLHAAESLRAISEAEAAIKPAPNKWSKKEILGHLIDSAANNHQRFVRLQMQDSIDLPGYEQDGWVGVQSYQRGSWRDIVDLWQSYNRHLAHLVATVKPDALRHVWNTPSGKTLDLEFIMRDYVVHLKHHLRQILG
jgi:hypothetical protein